jgi:glyoxylase-like metal-dependent hydrolase (beta-lactamase superfamily II)
MRKSRIAEDIYLFEFNESNSNYGNNITALIQDNRALLIDVSYEKYAAVLRKYLLENGVTDFTILLSHHHEDHFDGCKCFDDAIFYASNLFLTDPQSHLESDVFLKNFKPDKWLTENLCISFGSCEVKCFYTPGHNRCGFSFLINNEILHASDLFFTNSEGLPSIPYLDDSSTVSEYIYSLNKIKSLDFEILIQGHGSFIVGGKQIQEEINNRFYYLKNLKVSKGDISLVDCLLGDVKSYSGTDFHTKNCILAKYE